MYFLWMGVFLRQMQFFSSLLLSILFLSGTAEADTDQDNSLIIIAPEIPGASEPGEYGRDIEIVKATFDECGWNAKFSYQPFGRHTRTYRDSSFVDAATTVPLQNHEPGSSTSAYVWYQYGAFYNASRVGSIYSLNDLAGLRVVTFKDGIQILGLESLIEEFGLLVEITDQKVHSRMQLMGRVDVILSDGLVAATINQRTRMDRRFLQRWPTEGDTFVFYPLFNPTPYKMVFRDPERADQFDRCFHRLRMRGKISEINQKYIGQYQQWLLYRYLGD